MNYWIFQSNPKTFDIDTYLKDNLYVRWSIRQEHYLDIIKPDDEVFIWRSETGIKGTGGIIARATIVDNSKFKGKNAVSKYYIDTDISNDYEYVSLKVIEKRLYKGFIPRLLLSKHSDLKELKIINVRNETNYLISNTHAGILIGLWESMKLIDDIYADHNIDMFFSLGNTRKLRKKVGTSQYTDGVRIEKEFHTIFNPPDSEFYVGRGKVRPIKVLFNNKIFDAEYRYEEQSDENRQLQSIRFRKELKSEFKEVFPSPEGEFCIELGKDLNHFVFSHSSISVLDSTDEDEEKEYTEGKEYYRIHRMRERKPEVIKKAKELFFKKHSRLFCEACGFDFTLTYGERGRYFIEGHHKKLVSELMKEEKTRVEDIALLCSNCHRMIHRKPLITIMELKKAVSTKRIIND